MTEQQISEPEAPKGTFEEGKATADRLFDENPGSQCPRTNPVPSDFKSGLEQRWLERLVEWNEKNEPEK